MAGRNRFRRECFLSVSVGSLIAIVSDENDDGNERAIVGIITRVYEIPDPLTGDPPKRCHVSWADDDGAITKGLWSMSANNCITALDYWVLVR